jgi:hypothetical protein
LPCAATSSNQFRRSRQFHRADSECIPKPPLHGPATQIGNPNFCRFPCADG